MSIKNLRKLGKANKGITLIALVITIIVLLILAGISIATLTGENGILNKASKAKEEHLIEQYKEEINLIIIDEVAERKTENKDELMIVSLDTKIRKKEWVGEIYKCNSSGEEQPTFEASTHLLVESKEHYEFLIEVNEAKQTAKIVSSQKGTGEKYIITYHPNGGEGQEEIVEIRQGFSVTLKECEFTRDQYKFVGWCENQNGEGERFLGNASYKPEGQVTLYAIWKPLVTPGEIVTDGNKEYSKNGTAVIPEGFMIVPGCDDVSEGLVISDDVTDTEINKNNIVANGNQFVWVPVDPNNFSRIAGYYNKERQDLNNYEEPYTEASYTSEKVEYELMVVSCKENKGFYIGRYEVGKDVSGNAVIQKGANVYNNVPWGESMTNPEGVNGAVKLARNFVKTTYEDKGKTVGVKSTLCYGIQWDTALKFIDSGYMGFAKDSSKQGWYEDNYNSKTTGNTTINADHKTGIDLIYNNSSIIANKQKNIYDMAGNVRDWTMEAYGDESRVTRGGNYWDGGYDYRSF